MKFSFATFTLSISIFSVVATAGAFDTQAMPKTVAEAKFIAPAPVLRIPVEVTEDGFKPSAIDVKPGSTVVLEVTRKTDATCSTEIQVPSRKIKRDLPLNKTVAVNLGRVEKGEIRFGCGMNMMDGGKIIAQ